MRFVACEQRSLDRAVLQLAQLSTDPTVFIQSSNKAVRYHAEEWFGFH
jgi:hypothetical protein